MINLDHHFVRPYGVDSAVWTLMYFVGLSKRQISKQSKVKYDALTRPRISPATRNALTDLLIKYADIIERHRVIGGSRRMNKALREANKARLKFINFVIEEPTEIA